MRRRYLAIAKQCSFFHTRSVTQQSIDLTPSKITWKKLSSFLLDTSSASTAGGGVSCSVKSPSLSRQTLALLATIPFNKSRLDITKETNVLSSGVDICQGQFRGRRQYSTFNARKLEYPVTQRFGSIRRCHSTVVKHSCHLNVLSSVPPHCRGRCRHTPRSHFCQRARQDATAAPGLRLLHPV